MLETGALTEGDFSFASQLRLQYLVETAGIIFAETSDTFCLIRYLDLWNRKVYSVFTKALHFSLLWIS